MVLFFEFRFLTFDLWCLNSKRVQREFKDNSKIIQRDLVFASLCVSHVKVTRSAPIQSPPTTSLSPKGWSYLYNILYCIILYYIHFLEIYCFLIKTFKKCANLKSGFWTCIPTCGSTYSAFLNRLIFIEQTFYIPRRCAQL